ncbi:hypothetical protein FHG68_18055 [Leptospira weilii]|nr:hypothetical protein FHG67_18000 [Leptospira weilii]QDK28348.1 hypothetical protein FHG68_18055 [Leptospira weilii]
MLRSETIPLGSHNVTHRYLDPKINLSELRQILRETIGPAERPISQPFGKRDLSLGALRLIFGRREDSRDFSIL